MSAIVWRNRSRTWSFADFISDVRQSDANALWKLPFGAFAKRATVSSPFVT